MASNRVSGLFISAMRPLSFNGLSRPSLFGPLVQLQANFVNFLSSIIKELDAKDF